MDILDRPGGDVVARFRHLRAIEVRVGDNVQYGQALGMQSNVATDPIHVHIEMDTRYYRQFRNYVDDLASGRLPLEAEHREGVLPREVVDDGSFRLGESSERIRDIQRVMDAEGYRAPGGARLELDGVYRLRMQGALLDFQRDHGVPQTGDVDPATLRFAPPARRRAADLRDHTGGGGFPALERDAPTAPGHPDHPDHRPGLPAQLEPPLNQRRGQAVAFDDPHLARLAAALAAGDDVLVSRTWAEFSRSPAAQAFAARGRAALEAQETGHREAGREDGAPALSRG